MVANKVLELSREAKKKISFENYISFLKENQNLTKVSSDYNLQEYWENLRRNLNNYVHSNGKKFTSHNLINSNNKNLEIHLNNISLRSSYITTIFLVILIMVESALISSTDIIDYLDSDMEPPEGCQYEIAPFIKTILIKK